MINSVESYNLDITFVRSYFSVRYRPHLRTSIEAAEWKALEDQGGWPFVSLEWWLAKYHEQCR